MVKQVIKSERDLDEAIKSLDEKQMQGTRRGVQINIAFTILAIAVWIFLSYESMTSNTHHGYLRLAIPLLYAFVLIALIATLVGNVRRYRQRQWDNQKTLFDSKLGILNIALFTVYFNVLIVSDMITHREQVFYWPRLIDGGVDLPGIWLILPMLIVGNVFAVHVIRKRLHELHVASDKGHKTAI